jgi:hypothetical protein
MPRAPAHRDSFAIEDPRRIVLLVWPTRVIHVMTAVITARGADMTTITEENETTQATASSEEPKATKKARSAKRGAHVAPAKGKSAKKATPAKKGPKVEKKAEKPAATREGSKTALVLELLKRPDGATAKELMKATGWQPHSVRGFISGALGKKMGLSVESAKGENGERTYSIKG